MSNSGQFLVTDNMIRIFNEEGISEKTEKGKFLMVDDGICSGCCSIWGNACSQPSTAYGPVTNLSEGNGMTPDTHWPWQEMDGISLWPWPNNDAGWTIYGGNNPGNRLNHGRAWIRSRTAGENAQLNSMGISVDWNSEFGPVWTWAEIVSSGTGAYRKVGSTAHAITVNSPPAVTFGGAPFMSIVQSWDLVFLNPGHGGPVDDNLYQLQPREGVLRNYFNTILTKDPPGFAGGRDFVLERLWDSHITGFWNARFDDFDGPVNTLSTGFGSPCTGHSFGFSSGNQSGSVRDAYPGWKYQTITGMYSTYGAYNGGGLGGT